jgi:hypothetical protein
MIARLEVTNSATAIRPELQENSGGRNLLAIDLSDPIRSAIGTDTDLGRPGSPSRMESKMEFGAMF